MPDRRAERSAGSAATVTAAWLLLLCLVIGVPLALAALFGWPLSGVRVPHGMPRDPWTLHTLSRWAAVAVWILWAQFTAAVATEIRAVRSGRPASAAGTRSADRRKVRGKPPAERRAHAYPRWNLSHALARSLVAVTFAGALSSAGATVASAQTMAAAAPVAAVAVLPVSAAAAPGAAPGSLAPDSVQQTQQQSAAAAPQYQYYEVQEGDSLWVIAARYLGDGDRYTDIATLNLGRMQPDGSELEDAGLIQPGWILTLPGDAQGAGLLAQPPAAAAATPPTTVTPPATSPPAAGSPAPASGAPSASPTANGSSASAAATQIGQRPATTVNGSTHKASDTSAHSAKPAPAPAAGSSGVLPHPVASRPALSGDESSPKRPVAENTVLHTIADALPYVALIGSPVLAAALLGALTSAARRRRRDHPGAPLLTLAAPPDPAVAEVERTIRAAAATDTVDLIDRAMRGLWTQTPSGAGAAAAPPVRFARADPECLHLLFERPVKSPPAPWTAQAGGKQWRADRGAAEFGDGAPAEGALTGSAAAALAVPFPLLLCIGSAGEEQVMVNLAAAPGRSTVLTGPARQRRAVLAAAAATLAASPWSAQVRIEAVGLPPELALLAPDRLRIHPTLNSAISALRSGAAADAGAQILSADPAEPSPIRLLIVEGIQPYDLTQLSERLDLPAEPAPDHLGAAVLVGCDTPPPDSSCIAVDSIGRLRVPGIAGELSAARLPDTLASALGALFRSAERPRIANRPADLPEPAQSGAAGPDPLDRPAGIRVCLLGPVELYGTTPVDPSRGPLFTEALVLLLFYRAGLPAAVFSRALWPRGITYAARDRMLRDLRTWLGSGPSGPRLVLGPDSLVRLSWDVRSDWEEFQAAYRTAGQFADDLSAPRPQGAADGAELADLAQSELARALRLVRGELLADRPQGRYSWLGFGTQETEVPAVVADAGYRLAEVRLRSGDASGAQWAADQGLLGAPDDERLVQIKLRAIAARGDRELLHDAVADLRVRAWRRYGETDLRPETGAVVDQMMAMIAG
ncbi:MAG TPA: LysM peptidoglycan-binding domain-containing protein [Actinocrinis sp.]